MGSTDAVHIENVSAVETWRRLQADPQAVLIDVRTRAEWTYVGTVDLSSIGKDVLLGEWQTFPHGHIDPAFRTNIENALNSHQIGKDAELFFICRSGARSLAAARMMTGAGYTRCRNVADGFEGPLDAHGHRGRIAGWKASSLPWTQG